MHVSILNVKLPSEHAQTFYDTLYNFNPELDKRQYHIGILALSETKSGSINPKALTLQSENLQHTASSEVHKLQRRAFEPFFSRAKVLKLESLVQERVEKICKRLQEARALQQPANKSLLYRSLTADVICEYAFSDSYDFLNRPEESSSFFRAFIEVARLLWIVREIPWANKVLLMFSKGPTWAQPKGRGMRAVMKYQKVRHFH